MHGTAESEFSVHILEQKMSQMLDTEEQDIHWLSRWLIRHKENCATVVQTWISFLKDQESQAKKLILLSLADDVIRNSREKGPEYMNEFAPVLKQAFESIVRFVSLPFS